jgi:excisionase family DNA binding protein
MNLSAYVSVAEACRIAGVSKGYMCSLIRSGRIKAERIGVSYAVLRSSLQTFERLPGMGRPRKAAATVARKPARRPRKPRK